MNIHEYQAKKILADFGVIAPKGQVAYTPTEAKVVADIVSKKGPWMLKAQIQSGARQSGYFIEKKSDSLGGIRLVDNRRKIMSTADYMLNNTLVTIQTGPDGKKVNKIYVEAFQKVKKSFYIGLTINRITAELVLLAANVSDGNIIKIAINKPQDILQLPLSTNEKLSTDKLQKIVNFLHLPKTSYRHLENLINGLHSIFLNLDASMIEINPVGLDDEGNLWALDAKISFDDNALFRHPEIGSLADDSDLSERERLAKNYHFTYHEFTGSVGCIVNGDGVALSVMDLLKDRGSGAACFINVKGGVDKDKIVNGIKLIMTNPRVEGILLNILGGFVRCNLIADGIVAAASEAGLNVPMVVRFEGTNKDWALEILNNSHLPIIWADSQEDAVDKLLKQMAEAV